MKTFEIIEIGKNRRVNKSWPNKCVIIFSKNGGRIHTKGYNPLQLKAGSEILLSKSDDIFYISNITNADYAGLSLHKTGKSEYCLVFCAKNILTNGICEGYYEIFDTEIFDKKTGLGWYECRLLKRITRNEKGLL